MITYIERFKEKALDCKEMIREDELINLCIKGMRMEYKASNFAELMEKVKKIDMSITSLQKKIEEPTGGTWSKHLPFKRKVSTI